MDSKAVTPWYTDKALYVTVLGLLVPTANTKFGLHLDAVSIAGYLVLAASYVVAHKNKSLKITLKELEMAAGERAIAALSTHNTAGGN